MEGYGHYFMPLKKFCNPTAGAHVYLYGWKSHKLISSGVTNDDGSITLKGNPLSRYHLEVVYSNNSKTHETVTPCYDIKASYDWIDIAPDYAAPREGHILI